MQVAAFSPLEYASYDTHPIANSGAKRIHPSPSSTIVQDSDGSYSDMATPLRSDSLSSSMDEDQETEAAGDEDETAPKVKAPRFRPTTEQLDLLISVYETNK